MGECHQRHRHQEFLKFLRRLNTEFPGDIPLHLIMDNYGTHKHAKANPWLKRNPRFMPHLLVAPCDGATFLPAAFVIYSPTPFAHLHSFRTVLAIKGPLRRAQQRRALDGSGSF